MYTRDRAGYSVALQQEGCHLSDKGQGHWVSLMIALNKTVEVLFLKNNNIAVRVRT